MEDALDPTVSTRSKPGCAGSAASDGLEVMLSSWGIVRPGRRANGLRMGIMGEGHTGNVAIRCFL